MATFKKIILYLFGIVLLIFGNRGAINTLFASEAENKDAEPMIPRSPSPALDTDTLKDTSEAKPTANEKPTSKKAERKAADENIKAESANSNPKPKDEKVTKSETKIEPAKKEEASGTE